MKGREMRRSQIFPLVVVAVLGLGAALAGCAGSVDARSQDPPRYAQPLTGEAAEHFAAGRSARSRGDWEVAAAEFAKAVEAAPLSVEAHDAFVAAVKAPFRGDKERTLAALRSLDERYGEMMEVDPTNPVLAYTRGRLWFYDDRERCRSYLELATEIDPGFAPAFAALATLSEGLGDRELVRSYVRRAIAAEPENPLYLGRLAGTYMHTDWERFRPLAEDVVDRFPGTADASKWLYWLGQFAPTEEARISYLERSIRENPIERNAAARNRWVESAYRSLYGIYVERDPQRAAVVAQDAARAILSGDARVWTEIYRKQSLVNLGRGLRELGRAEEAVSILREAGPPTGRLMAALVPSYHRELALAHLAAGDTAEAREALLELLRQRSDTEARRSLEELHGGDEAGREEVVRQIWQTRLRRARPAPEFALPGVDGKLLSLAELRGKMVLLNFWFPACGPCRAEFPYLEQVARKFADRGLVVLAANIHPAEAAEVEPFLRNTGYPFIGLQTNPEWAKETYGVTGTPRNFLIDPEGRIVHEPAIYNLETQLELERWLEWYLEYRALERPGAVAGSVERGGVSLSMDPTPDR